MSGNQAIDSLIGRVFKGYKVIRFIARGGMGLVFEGTQESLDRSVAIKFLYPHLSSDEQFRERFEREARAVARLDHPNIVRVLDYGYEDGMHLMILDYIDGVTLRDHLIRVQADGLTLRTETVATICRQVASALTYAHERGYVHRDVKPGNIMLTRQGRAFLTDFGVVKDLDAMQGTMTGAVIGTPEYMAPEQASGAAVGPASDIYALAVVSYEMLLGRVPFQAPTPVAVLTKHLHEPPPPPSTIAPWFGGEIDAVYQRALAKHPGDRQPSAEAFATELIDALNAPRGSQQFPPGYVGSGIPTVVSAPPQSGQPGQYYTPAPGTPSQPGYTPQPHPGYGQTPPPSGYAQPVTGTPSSYPQPVTGTPPSYAQPLTGAHVGGVGQPQTGYPVGMTPPPAGTGTMSGAPPSDANPPSGVLPPSGARSQPDDSGRGRVPIIAGVLLVAVLLLGIGGFYVLTQGDDDDDDTGQLGAAGTTEATASNGAQSPADATDTQAVEPISAGAETPTSASETPADAESPTSMAGDATPTGMAAAETPEAPAGPQPVVVFSSHRGDVHDSQIYVMAIDGSDQRQITTARGHSWAPRTSPDGTMMFFSSVAAGEHQAHDAAGGGTSGSGNHDIYVSTLTGSTSTDLRVGDIENVTAGQLTWDNGWAWSPDGSLITYATDRDGNWDIYTMYPDGSNQRRVTTHDANDGWPAWTPDGEHIVFSSDRTGDWEIFIMDADGLNVRQLTDRPNTTDLFPEVSPDGTRIVFSSQVESVNEGEIYMMTIDGGDITRLTSTAALNNMPSWCPSGEDVVFTSDRDGNENIYLMSIDGTKLVRLTDDPGEDTTPFCTTLGQ